MSKLNEVLLKHGIISVDDVVDIEAEKSDNDEMVADLLELVTKVEEGTISTNAQKANALDKIIERQQRRIERKLARKLARDLRKATEG